MIPGRGFFVAGGLWAALALATAFYPALFEIWGGVAIAFLVLAWFDYRRARGVAPPAVERRVQATMPLGIWQPVSIIVHAGEQGALNLSLFDHYPHGGDVEGLPLRARVPARGRVELDYRYRPVTRGDQAFNVPELRIDSPLGIWRRQLRHGPETAVRVYPNFAEVAKYALLATDNRLSQMGIRKRPRRGEGLDFHQLREYQSGDSLRQIDWKATSRMRKLISREYQVERDQQIMLVLDCGRRMLTRDGEFSHFDHTLNAVLLLAHVALRQGDFVGLRTFGGSERRVAPRKGPGTQRRILESVYDLQPSPASADYLVTARQLAGELRKRTLIVFVTNLRHEDLQEIVPAIRLLQRRHLVLLASLREHSVGATLEQPINNFDDALLRAAVHSYLLGRRRLHDMVRQNGVDIVDVEASELAIRVVNRYLDIKRSGVL